MDKNVETNSFGAREKSWTRKERRKKKIRGNFRLISLFFRQTKANPFFVLLRGGGGGTSLAEESSSCFVLVLFLSRQSLGKSGRTGKRRGWREGERRRGRKKALILRIGTEGGGEGEGGMGERKKKAFFMPRDLERKVPPWDLPTDPLFFAEP